MAEVIDPKKIVKLKGIVKETLPGTQFIITVDIKGNAHDLLGYISGKMRMNYIKLQVGDQVEIEMTPYDLKKGRIVYRY